MPLRRLRTVPGVAPITALTLALEVGDTSRFHNIKQAISYCGLCSAERSSADKVMRMPISKPRNKHIRHVLVEAAKLAPRQCHELALIYERDSQIELRNWAEFVSKGPEEAAAFLHEANIDIQHRA